MGNHLLRSKWVWLLGFVLLSNLSIAQSVPSKSLWLRADEGVNLSGSRVTTWFDRSGNSRNAIAPNTAKRPLFKSLGSNFNPTLYFDGSDNLDVSYTSALNTSSFTVFSVHRLTGGQNRYRSPFTSRDDSPQKGYIVYAEPGGKYQFWNGAGNNGGWQVLSSSRMAASQTELLVYKGSQSGSQLTKRAYINGQIFAGAVTHNFSANTQRPFRVGAGATEGTGNYFWYGDISEQIVFNSPLTDTQRLITESYLGIKYGLSIGNNSQSINYLKANGGTVWLATSAYRYDIAGIARESSPFDLDQRISSSSNVTSSTGGNVTIATSNDFSSLNTSGSRPPLSNGQYLLWGHNNQSMNSWVNVNCSKRISRYWRLQNTANVGLVYFQIKLSGFPSSPTGTYTLFLDNDTDLSNGVQGTYSLTSSGGFYTTSFNPPSGVTYFTIGVKDETLPVFTSCPSNIQVCSGSVVNWTAPTATDNCGNPTITGNKTSGQVFPDGQTVVTYTATDAWGNSSTCNFTVTVNALPAPSGAYQE